MREKNYFGRLPLLIFALLLFVTVTPIHAADQGQEKLKIAMLLPLSGGAAQWGIGILRGAELMIEKINREGGVRVGDKRLIIEAIKADDKSTPETALAQINRLVFNEKIKYSIGPIVSGSCLVILPVTTANQVIQLNYGYTANMLGADKPYSFRLYASGHERIPAIYGFLKEKKPQAKTVAIIAPNDETGWSTTKHASESAGEYGYKVVFDDYFPRGTTDFFPLLTKMIAKRPDFVIPHSLLPGEMALMLQQSHQLGYKGLIYSPSFYDLKTLVDKAGKEAVEGFVYQWPSATGSGTTEGISELYKSYEKKFGEPPLPMAFPGYAAPWVLKLAIEKAGTIDSAVVAKIMSTLSGEYPYGRFSMGGTKRYGISHQIAEPIFFSEIRTGRLEGLGSVTPPVP